MIARRTSAQWPPWRPPAVLAAAPKPSARKRGPRLPGTCARQYSRAPTGTRATARRPAAAPTKPPTTRTVENAHPATCARPGELPQVSAKHLQRNSRLLMISSLTVGLGNYGFYLALVWLLPNIA